MDIVHQQKVHRVIVAMPDRRGTIPMRELLDLPCEVCRSKRQRPGWKRCRARSKWKIFTQAGSFLRTASAAVRHLSGPARAIDWDLPGRPGGERTAVASGDADNQARFQGPVFYSQRRVGKSGRVFSVIKFRTMRQDAEAGGPQWAGLNDPRITKVGKFLRSSRLDEIPQLWCVLKGDMAFVDRARSDQSSSSR